MARRALILGWSHPSDAVLSLAASLAGGLESNRFEVTILNLFDAEHRLKLTGFARRHFSQVYFLGALALTHSIDGQLAFEYFAAVCFFWVLDPIIYDLRSDATRKFIAAARKSDRRYLLFPDRSYMGVLQPLLPKRCFYFPFAATFAARASPPAADGDAAGRSAALLVANIGQELSEFAAWSAIDIIRALEPFRLAAGRAASLAEHVVNDEAHSNVTVAVAGFLGLAPNDLLRPPTIALLAALDASEKRRRRRAAVEAIRSVPLDVIGSGWKPIIGLPANIRYLRPSIPHGRLADTFRQYKVVVDFAPNWDHGFNDRVMIGLSAGCRVVTSRNSAIGELDGAAPLVATYSAHRPQPESAVERALEAPPIGQEVLTSLGDNNDWSARVRQLFSVAPS